MQSHWFSVGFLVPWAKAGVGAVATQSFVKVDYGPDGIQLMESGMKAADALKALTDKDEGEFGLVHYSLAGTYKDAFYIGPEDGRIIIVDSSVLDREVTDHITLQVVASDYAPVGAVKSVTVPVNITIRDVISLFSCT